MRRCLVLLSRMYHNNLLKTKAVQLAVLSAITQALSKYRESSSRKQLHKAIVEELETEGQRTVIYMITATVAGGVQPMR